jgi:hypothetical protein
MQVSDGFHFGPRPYHKTRGTANSGFRGFKFKDNGKERIIKSPGKKLLYGSYPWQLSKIRSIGEEEALATRKKGGEDGISNGRIAIKRNFL